MEHGRQIVSANNMAPLLSSDANCLFEVRRLLQIAGWSSEGPARRRSSIEEIGRSAHPIAAHSYTKKKQSDRLYT